MMVGSREEAMEFSSSFPDQIFDFAGTDIGAADKSSSGFLDLLGFHDFPQPLLDFAHPLPVLDPGAIPPPAPESSETVNFPATPNSSNISSASTDRPDDGDALKPSSGSPPDAEAAGKGRSIKGRSIGGRKKGQKPQREQRFAFMTKSEVDHLEDGYRWRKYGQKAVKNSPFPRSYYRCTSATCGVKKRVERSCEDPTIVVTTYEGQHTHPCPVLPRGGGDAMFAAAAAVPSELGFTVPPIHFQGGLSLLTSYLPPPPLDFRRFVPPPAATAMSAAAAPSADCRYPNPLRDRGLLQDLIPASVVRVKEEE